MTTPTPPPGETTRRTDAAATTAEVLRHTMQDLRIELAIHTRRVAALVGLNESDLDVLDVLNRGGPQSPTALARRMGIHPATMTGVLRRLETKGWIIRRHGVPDQRSVQIEAAGLDRLSAVFADTDHRADALADQLAPTDATAVIDYLRKAAAVVRTATRQLADATPLHGGLDE